MTRNPGTINPVNYAFGMTMPGRNGSRGDYRYGFQNQEKDNEIKGDNNILNYEYRMHDPRLGRFLSLDPLQTCFPSLSPYQFLGNSPITNVDLEGLEPASYLIKFKVKFHTQLKNPHGEGKLTKPFMAFLSAAFGYDEQSLINTTWYVSCCYWGIRNSVAEISLATGSDACTLGKDVVVKGEIYDDETRTQQYWAALIAHEQKHRDEIYKMTSPIWYTMWLAEALVYKYEEMPLEQRAYSIALGTIGGWGIKSKFDDFLSDKVKFKRFEDLMTDNTTSENKKIIQMKLLAIDEFVLPDLDNEISIIKNYVRDIKKLMVGVNPTSFEYQAYNELLNRATESLQKTQNKIKSTIAVKSNLTKMQQNTK